jgi:starch synthase (maltosyl-transferring)
MATKPASKKGTLVGAIAPGSPGRLRVIIEGVRPQVDGGRFAIKRVLGEPVVVEADVFTDGHDLVTADLLYRHEDEKDWQRLPMRALVNDRWRARFVVERLGRYRYTIAAWVDHFQTWRQDLTKRRAAGQDLRVEYRIGAAFVRAAAARAPRGKASPLNRWAKALEEGDPTADATFELAQDPALAEAVRAYPDPQIVKRLSRELAVTVDRERARYSTWYEFFPRSCTQETRVHGTFADAATRLDYVAGMGFDIVYLPPIHPIGHNFRKGKNNAVEAGPGDVGSPWAIGSEEGGHKSVHPELGTLEDFRAFVARARELGMEVALDIAFQASPDHPYVREHPEWFLERPDGSIQYAENPPKKYQDIYPFYFETTAWQSLWQELKSVFDFWIEQGVYVFRVDNPHTKAFRFWEWCVSSLKREHPELIFLSEAFTRPKVMHRLAKLGFTQSYTYFTWRNTKHELIEYFTELAQEPGREYFRPNVWPNTPDILPEYLQFGGRPASVVRLILAATLSANYGIYGPVFELYDARPRKSGTEEYLDSEKYQIRLWDLKQPGSLKDLIARVNRIRHEHPALQQDWGLRFHLIDNDQLIAYSKQDESGEDLLLIVVNLDCFHRQSGWLELPLADLAIEPHEPYQVHDLLGGAHYIWQGSRNFIALDPNGVPAHIFKLRRHVAREQDYDYYR